MDIVDLITSFLPLVRDTTAWSCSAREKYLSARSELDALAAECQTISSNLSVLLALYKTTAGVGQVPDEAEIWMQMKVEITSCEDTIKSIRRKMEPYGLETSVKVKYVMVGEDISVAKQLSRLRGHHANLTTSLSVLVTHNMQRVSHSTVQLRELYNNQLDTLSRVLNQPSFYSEGASSPNASLTSSRRDSERGSDGSLESSPELNVYVMTSAPYLRHLVKDRHRVEGEKKQLENKNHQLRDDKQRLRNEKHQLEAEKRKLETSNRHLEEEKRLLEKEKWALEEDNKKLMQQKWELQEEKRQLEAEKKQLEDDKSRLEDDKKQLEEEKRHLQRDKRRLEDEKRHLQEEKRQLEEEKRQLQDEKAKLEKDRKRHRGERTQWMTERNELEEEKKQLEMEWVGERVRDTINSVFDTISKL